ncbi:ABC transporter substrate-binding protein [Streptomyces beijiangensis]|uniref:Peptide-binding protein n=1 Tax=Streptomyces beijiangensis TaxID=163361 RepID=A0A939F2N4_9ACTN|nr:ABC transporter substrate-binding protein [Streptomyces beijiangensis]MBO0510639.1 peptide-binding protein [Streptomyces beijiangensis]
MRSIRLRILMFCVVLAIVGVGAWQLLPDSGVKKTPIRVGTTDVVSSLDPAVAYDAGSWALYSEVYQSLMTFDRGSATPVPDAATSCRFEDSSLRTFSCRLRDDLHFSNGHKVTPEDVVFSFRRVLKIHNDNGPGPLLATLDTVDSAGDKITFHLKTRDATFASKIATGAGAILDHTAYPATKAREGGTVDGSGPYVLKEYKDGVSATLEPNPQYKGAIKKSGTAIAISYFKQPEQLNAAWKSGLVDVTHRELPPSVLSKLSPGAADIHVNEVSGSEIRNLVFNVHKNAPFANVALRRAAAWLVDRAQLADQVYSGTVEPLYSVIPQGLVGHSTSFFDSYPSVDVSAARKVLERAGVQTPVEMNFAYSSTSTTDAEAALLKKQLETGGLFKVKLTGVAKWQAFQDGYAAGKYDAYALGWIADYPDADNYAQPLVGTDNSLSNGFTDPEIDRLITHTQEFNDRARTAQDFRTLQDLVAKDVPLIPLWQRTDYVLTNKDVTGGQYLSDGTGVWRLWELGWI